MYVYLRRFLVERILCAVGISAATTEKGRIGVIKFIGCRGQDWGFFLWRYDKEGRGDGKQSLNIDIPESFRCCMCSNFQNTGSICRLGNGATERAYRIIFVVKSVAHGITLCGRTLTELKTESDGIVHAKIIKQTPLPPMKLRQHSILKPTRFRLPGCTTF